MGALVEDFMFRENLQTNRITTQFASGPDRKLLAGRNTVLVKVQDRPSYTPN